MKIIGITGGVGAGKSQVLKLIRDNYNCITLLADDIGNQIKEPGEPCYEPLIELLGQDILGEDGRIDKLKMAGKIFADSSLLEKVNEIIHPAVITRIKEMATEAREEGSVDYFFIEAALLIECGFNSFVDEMWYIYARPEVRRERLRLSRGYSDEKIDNIMASQLSDEEFRVGSDVVIDNSDELDNTERQIRERLK